jgi:hypothetical protein
MTGAEAPIFVVGCPRSGTTLLRNLLRAHPRLTLPPESHFIPSFYRRHGHPGSDRDATRLAATILRLSRMRTWQLDLDPATLRACRTFGEVVAGFFAAWAEREGKPRWGDKTPQYATEIPTLREIFPQCQIIHCIRDGRDVALSYCRAPFGPGNVYAAAREWRRFVTAGRQAGTALPPQQYAEVHYETLVTAPDATMRRVFAFLGEPPVQGEIRPNPIRKDPDARFGTLPIKRISNTEIASGNTQKWKREMAVPDRVLFESVCGDLLHELGYEVEGLARPISGVEDLFWRTQNVASVLVRRSRAGRLPGAVVNALLRARDRLARHRRS